MKLLTQEVLKKFAKFGPYSQDGKGNDAEILVKFFTPDSSWSWFVLEAEQVPCDIEGGYDLDLFGIVRSHMETVYGHFSFRELEAVRGPLGLRIERDRHFHIKTVGELRQSTEIPSGALDWLDKRTVEETTEVAL